jgi:membrane-associated phospholipid phosphatase
VTRYRCLFLAGILVLSFHLGILPAPPTAEGAGLVDVPLKPWTYFELNRDWTYTAIEKLVTAGLVGPWVLNTKPMSRMEMARIVTVAMRKIQEDQIGRFAQRTDLEPILYDLMEEFAPELEAMAVRKGEDEFAGQPWLSFQPLSHLQTRGFAVKQDSNPENSQGLKLARRYDGTVGFDSYFQFGDFMSGYLYPEFQIDEHNRDGRVVEGYLKLKLNNVALRFGRESLWWGPGYHGSLMFSNNAPPMDQIRIGTAEPIILPWFLKYLGPTRLELMYARLEANRDHPHAVLGSWRVDFSPLQFLELGYARTVQMGGQGRPAMSALNYLAGLVISKNDPSNKYNTNQLYTVDATLRLHDVDRVFPLSRDLALYAEMEVDDTCCKNVVWPLKPAYMVGVYLPNLFGRDDSELRVEWAETTSFSYTHSIYTNGFSFEGFPLANYIAARGQDLYVRGAERILPNLQVGTEFGYAKVGSTEIAQLPLPREQRKYVGLDISYQPIPALSLLLGYRYERIDNKDFVAGQRANNHIVRLEATYSLPALERGLIGRPRRADAMRPMTPPPAPRGENPPDIDPDEVVSANYAKRLFQDTGTLLISPLRWGSKDWLIFAGVGATAGGLMLADKEIRSSIQKKRNDTSDTLANVFRPFETIAPATLVAGMAGIGYAFDQPKLKAASADALEASLISVGVFAVPAKFFIGRSRPNRDQGPAHYEPFNLGSSLPSFTTANAFAVASALSEHFPHPAVSILAYGLAGAAGIARIYDDKHWASDVFLGAALGTVIGKAVAKLNEQRREKSRVSVVPLLGQGVQGAALQVEF